MKVMPGGGIVRALNEVTYYSVEHIRNSIV